MRTSTATPMARCTRIRTVTTMATTIAMPMVMTTDFETNVQ